MTIRSTAAADGTDLFFDTHGDPTAPAVMMGPYFTATRFIPDGIDYQDPTETWIAGLQDDYFLVLADYPRGLGLTKNPQGLATTPELVCDDYSRIADAAGIDQFAWVGYSWGGAIGIQMASRTRRINALVCGGFPPYPAPYARMKAISEGVAAAPPASAGLMGMDALYLLSPVGFYGGLIDWPEAEHVPALTMPCMAFMGDDDRIQGLGADYDTPLTDMLQTAEPKLRNLGWEINWLKGRNHATGIQPDLALPIVRDFLGRAVADG